MNEAQKAAVRKNVIRQVRSMVGLLAGGSLAFAAFAIRDGNDKFFRDYVMPVAKLLDPETAHRCAIYAMKYKIIAKQRVPDPPSLGVKVLGMNFTNPVGIAAGFDKQGEAMQGLHRTGFGFVEIGSVTPEPQEGNDKPRVFRLPEDNAIINRYGFNSEGHEVVYQRVNEEVKKPDRAIIGINLGKNKTSPNAVEDYVDGVQKFGAIADYLVINVSSPNTPGLRGLQQKDELETLISNVLNARNNLKKAILPPLLLKVSPDLSDSEKQDIANVITKENCRIDGLIVTNTTISRPNSLSSKHRTETGGLSGQPLKDLSTKCVGEFYRLTGGRIPIIGVGGVASGQDAFEKIQAGASLVQLYSALAIEGPTVVRRIKRELDDILKTHGYQNVSEAVGKANATTL
uniref:Dihydroorotate dehydrogenase (quinone), mitochondrial n=1 Tax=Moina brachiata TaxID=675436 RepID=A0A4Y7NJM8_9CRUS|nr:EOG090X08P9 [Moina brachiata]SVE93093.1 EOG090X08P9 [Moina brachiata]